MKAVLMLLKYPILFFMKYVLKGASWGTSRCSNDGMTILFCSVYGTVVSLFFLGPLIVSFYIFKSPIFTILSLLFVVFSFATFIPYESGDIDEFLEHSNYLIRAIWKKKIQKRTLLTCDLRKGLKQVLKNEVVPVVVAGDNFSKRMKKWQRQFCIIQTQPKALLFSYLLEITNVFIYALKKN